MSILKIAGALGAILITGCVSAPASHTIMDGSQSCRHEAMADKMAAMPDGDQKASMKASMMDRCPMMAKHGKPADDTLAPPAEHEHSPEAAEPAAH